VIDSQEQYYSAASSLSPRTADEENLPKRCACGPPLQTVDRGPWTAELNQAAIGEEGEMGMKERG